ncbi:E6 protein [Eumops bonariensis papillomavirus type 1]|nr:E6 protein [Eumops bonariensis papillomavirus type 1]
MADPAQGAGQGPPKTIRQLCELYRKDIDEVQLFCQFCLKCLTILDKICFEQSKFTLLWRCGSPRAVCVCCSRVLARIEFTERHEHSCPVSQAEQYIGGPITGTSVRCIRCLCDLLPQEKELLRRDNRTVHKICGGWRALCVRCAIGLY